MRVFAIRYGSYYFECCAVFSKNKKMSELKEGFPNDQNDKMPPDNDAVELGAEEAREKPEEEPKKERIVTFGDHNLSIKIPEERPKEK